jgi:hypothetical protein
MPHLTLQWPRRVHLLFLVAVFSAGGAVPAMADVVLYTASTDNSGFGGDPSVPAFNNPFLPPIDPGATLTPNPAFLDGNAVGPINGITYGPFAFGANQGGTTGWVHVSYTLTTGGPFRLVWEVSDVIDHTRASALAIDNVRLGNALLYGFEGGIPGGFVRLGSTGTSGAVTDLSPTQGAEFAWLDTTGNAPAVYDTVDGTFGSRLYSTMFTATAGTVLSMDLAFMTNDGGPFHDYGIVVLLPAPEPGTLTLYLLTSALMLVGTAVERLRRTKG